MTVWSLKFYSSLVFLGRELITDHIMYDHVKFIAVTFE